MGFTLLYFEMAVIPLVPETKMADVGKLISAGNLLVWKVTWLVLTITSATLILSRAFGADCMTRITYIYSLLLRTHCLSHFLLQRRHTLTHSILTHRDSFSLFISTSRNSLTLPFSKTQFNTCNMGVYTFYNLFLSSSSFSTGLFPASNIDSEIRQTPKETNNQHGRRHVPSRKRCYISIYRYLT